MIKYDQDWLTNLCNQVDLLDYASQQFEFRRSGSDSYATICPIHGDTDPSLVITPSKNMWYCFGCKHGGNVIGWMMTYEGLSFPRAVKKLAAMVGEEIPDFEPCTSLDAYKEIAKLSGGKHSKAVEKRQILPESYLDRFEIPPDGEPHEWLSEGIRPEAIKKYGIRLDTNGNRIIYPVYDDDDHLISVKGRTRFRNYKILGIAKYRFYTPIGCLDFFVGMHENRQNITKSGDAVIFEGIKSVMLADGWGYGNAVAAETSRLSDEQVGVLLKMRLRSVTLAFDSDVPREQVMEAAHKLSPFMNVYVVQDRAKLLGDPSEKMAPVDKGQEVWEQLYAERKRII